jgi:hypothetical protein
VWADGHRGHQVPHKAGSKAIIIQLGCRDTIKCRQGGAFSPLPDVIQGLGLLESVGQEQFEGNAIGHVTVTGHDIINDVRNLEFIKEGFQQHKTPDGFTDNLLNFCCFGHI